MTGINFVERDGDPILADFIIDDVYVPLLQPFFNSATGTIDRAELWEYTPESYDARFISSYTIGVAGTSGTAAVPASEDIFTFRTAEGGTLRIHLLDVITPIGPSIAYAGLGTPSQNLVDQYLASGNIALGRDTSQPIAFLKLHPGQNEAIWKSINRA